MNNALIIFQQTVIMFLYMAVGFFLFRAKLITKEGSVSMANLLLYIVLPAAIIQSFRVERTAENSVELLTSIGVGTLLLLAAMLVSHLLFRKNPIDDFGAAFSNAGFMGFPLITALLGREAIFYAAGFVAILNVLQWTYGQYILSGNQDDLNPRKVIRNPLVIAFAIGLIRFFTGLPFPGLVDSAIASVSSMNAPLAMVILGVYLAQLNVGKAVKEKKLYAGCAVRLILIPLISYVILFFLLPKEVSFSMKCTLFIAGSAPVGANVAVYAQKQGKDYSYAVGLVCLSTLLSIISMPVMMLLVGNMPG